MSSRWVFRGSSRRRWAVVFGWPKQVYIFYPQSPRGSLVLGGREFTPKLALISSIRIVYCNLLRWMSKSLDLKMIWGTWVFRVFYVQPSVLRKSKLNQDPLLSPFIWCNKSREVAALIPSLPAGKDFGNKHATNLPEIQRSSQLSVRGIFPPSSALNSGVVI